MDFSDEDGAIRSTNDDASLARVSAASAGYFSDPYCSLLVKARSVARKPPIINRGSYVRFNALNVLVDQFLASSKDCSKDRQIVILGAGSDTRFFLLKARSLSPKKVVEIDFPEITSKKAQGVKKNKQMAEMIGNHKLAAGGSEIHGDQYSIISGDLRNWDGIVSKLECIGFDKTIPTLFLAECVFVYMPPEAVENVLSWCSTVQTSMVVTYEQINPTDAFGQMMLDNLKLRNIALPSLLSYPSIGSQKQRFIDCGFGGGSHAMNMYDIFQKYVSREEQSRLAKLEIFDEVEEWKLMSEHYCVAWGWQTKDPDCKEWLGEIKLSSIK